MVGILRQAQYEYLSVSYVHILYYFHDIVYCSGNPFLIFLTLLCSCLAISMGMEYLKKAIRFDVFCKQLIRKLK